MSDDSKALVVHKKSRAPKGVIELPEELPPPLEVEEPIGPGPAQEPLTPEIVSEAEEKYHETNKQKPPEQVVTKTPMTKNSLVSPIEVQALTFNGFLEALDRIADDEHSVPILRGIKFSYRAGDDKLLLEAIGPKLWAAAGVKAWGGEESFEAVLPRSRAINIVRELKTKYTTLTIGMDEHRIHIGPFSFPFQGEAEHFPKQPTIEQANVTVAIPSSHLADIPERVYPAVNSENMMSPGGTAIFLDFEEHVAVATDGHRLHALSIPMMHVELERGEKIPTGTQIPVEVFRYLSAVESRDWTGFKIGESKIMAGHEDFGLIADIPGFRFPKWKKTVPVWPGFWIVKKEVLEDAVVQASMLLEDDGKSGVTLLFDHHAASLTIVSKSDDGEHFEKTVEAKPSGNMGAYAETTLKPTYLFDAFKACRGDMVKIGTGGELAPVTFRGDDNCFTAVVMPMRRR